MKITDKICTTLLLLFVPFCSFAEPSGFCEDWKILNQEEKFKVISTLTIQYAKTSPRYSTEMAECSIKETNRLIMKNNKYYLCDSKEDFGAGLILGEAMNTAVFICGQRHKKQ